MGELETLTPIVTYIRAHLVRDTGEIALMKGAVASLTGKSPLDNPYHLNGVNGHLERHWARGFALGVGVPGALAKAEACEV